MAGGGASVSLGKSREGMLAGLQVAFSNLWQAAFLLRFNSPYPFDFKVAFLFSWEYVFPHFVLTVYQQGDGKR